MTDTTPASTPAAGVDPSDMTWVDGGVDPAKAAFVEAIAWTLATGDMPLALAYSGYGEDGYSESSTDLDHADRYQIALSAWYRHARVPQPPSHLLRQEAAAWHTHHFGEAAVKSLEHGDPTWRKVIDLRDRLAARGWDADTSNDARFYEREQGHPARMHPETGQCAITSLIVQDELGGDLMRVEMPAGSIRTLYGEQTGGAGGHYYNRLPDGRIVDLTRGQFDTFAPVGPAETRTREYLLSNADTAGRYELLRARLAAGRYIPTRNRPRPEPRVTPAPERRFGRMNPGRS